MNEIRIYDCQDIELKRIPYTWDLYNQFQYSKNFSYTLVNIDSGDPLKYIVHTSGWECKFTLDRLMKDLAKEFD
jgi:hypothetical protein